MTTAPLDPTCFALVQVADEATLRARLPTAFDRGRVLVEEIVRATAYARGGAPAPSVARGWFVRFPDVESALGFSADLQWALLTAAWPPTLLVRGEAAEVRGPDGKLLHRGLRVKVAVHRGRVTAGADDRVAGPGVYHVARIVTVAHGGQVLVSEPAWRTLGGQVPAGSTVRDLGEFALVGVDGIGRLAQVLPTDLDGRVFPPLAARPASNLYVQEESTLGRDGDVNAICDLVRLGIRLVTVVGAPGVGKSRICRLSARALQKEAFPSGVWWCRPGEATVTSLVRCVANVLSVPLEEAASLGEAIDRVGYALSWRERIVIVVDHLAHRSIRRDGADVLSRDLRSVLDGWMRVARNCTFVVNTDVRFGLPGEVLYVLLPLASKQEESVRLFTERARAVDQDIQTADPVAVAELVERMGGMPLSIRLLAGIVDRFPVEGQLDWFRAGDLSEDRILPVVLDHLDEAEREVLAAGCALPGSFEPGMLWSEATAEAFALLDRLDRRGLVRRAAEPEAPEVLRYVVEEDVRRKVLEGLPVEEYRFVRDIRARTLLTTCEAWLGTQYERDRPELVARLAVEWEGLLEVVRIGREEAREDTEAVTLAARAVLVLRPVLEARGPAYVAAELLDAVVRRMDVMLDADVSIHLRVLIMRAQALRRVGRTASAFGDLERAEAMAERWSDPVGHAQCLIEAGRAQYEVGSAEVAVTKLEAAAALFRESEDPSGEPVANTYLGAVLMALGRYDDAEVWLQRALTGLRAHDLRLHEGRAVSYLAMLHRRTDRADTSRALYGDALQIVRECGIPSQESRWLAEVGLLDLNLDRVGDARRLLAEAAQVARRAGDRAAEGVVLRDLGMVSLAAGDFAHASQSLLAAVAIHRDRGDTGAEGADTGSLGWVHHLSDHLDEARAAYLKAIGLVRDFGDSRLLALFSGWLAACEAERGDIAAANEQLSLARTSQADSGDPQIGEAVDLLALVVRSRELEVVPDPTGAESLRQQVEQVRERMATRRTPLPAFSRLAWKRVSARPEFRTG